jgi:uncharacterized phage-associated protein
MSIPANDIAKVILSFSDPEVGDVITNLKLQKLLYYCQGFHLAMFEKTPLFGEKIFAWQYGPVVKEVYHNYKENGSTGIILENKVDTGIVTKKQLKLIKEVYKVYGQYSALRLMDMTHKEAPWQKTEIGEEITHKKMYEYFTTLVK